jgi:hypothetical protein
MSIHHLPFFTRFWRFAGAFSVRTKIMGIALALVLLLGVGITVQVRDVLTQALGHTSKEIADRLSISNKTVDTYRARGMEKLDLRSRAALVRFALAKGLLE